MSVSSTSRVTGLASGLDTEKLVEDMLSASKAKINKAKQQKTLLEWKQASYKSITSGLSSFQTKYFGSSGSLVSSLKKVSATYSSEYLSVSPSENSSQGKIVINDITSLASSAVLTGASSVSKGISMAVSTDNLAELSGKSIVVTLDGVSKTLTFSDKTYSSTDDVSEELSSLISSNFGNGRISLTVSNDEISLAAQNSVLSIRIPDTSEGSTAGILDFNGYALNRVDTSVALTTANLATSALPESGTEISFEINGVSFSFDTSKSLSDIMSAVNKSDAGVKMTYSQLTDSFSLVSTETGTGSQVSIKDTEGNLMASLFSGATYRSGTDASVNITVDDGAAITLTRSTNSFEVNGTVIKLLGKASDNSAEDISIKLDYDSQSIAASISTFIDDYNSLLSSITTLTSEKKYSDYAPLTDDERKDLSESEIALWTEKAKSGILRNDTYLTAIASELRSSMYTIVGSVGSLTKVGITTGEYSGKGKLYLDKDKLMAALESNCEETLSMFTQESSISYSLYATDAQKETRFQENGVLNRLSDILSKNLSSVGKKGALILLVGSPGSAYDSNTDYAKRITALDDKINELEDKLDDEEKRYWAQFTAMESALTKLNSQSSYISNLFGNSSQS
ncbi:MAG: flagellar filament capping protein FliD [Clostridiaceae bacterium]|nr:flagellar filament capping protein FliD [Clostridiaceae bacterium]